MDDVVPMFAAWWHGSWPHGFVRVDRRLLGVVEHLLRKGLESVSHNDYESSDTCEMTAILEAIQT